MRHHPSVDVIGIPDLQIPYRGLSIRDFHWLDLWQEGGFERLIQALEKGLGTTGRARLKPGSVFRDIDAPWCPEMVALSVGEFVMGSAKDEKERSGDEGPQHRVMIGYPFAIGRYPITVGEYRRLFEASVLARGQAYGFGMARRGSRKPRRAGATPGSSRGTGIQWWA